MRCSSYRIEGQTIDKKATSNFSGDRCYVHSPVAECAATRRVVVLLLEMADNAICARYALIKVKARDGARSSARQPRSDIIFRLILRTPRFARDHASLVRDATRVAPHCMGRRQRSENKGRNRKSGKRKGRNALDILRFARGLRCYVSILKGNTGEMYIRSLLFFTPYPRRKLPFIFRQRGVIALSKRTGDSKGNVKRQASLKE